MKRGSLFLLFMAISIAAISQRMVDENSKLSERIYFGGGLGLNGGTDSYGNRYFYVGLYPIVGYMVNNQFSVGTGISYQYYSYPDFDQSYSQYGISPFARYSFGQVFLYSEYSLLNTPTTNNAIRKNYSRLLLGVGFTQPLGQRSALNVMGLYDVLWVRTDLAFASPWVLRIFFTF